MLGVTKQLLKTKGKNMLHKIWSLSLFAVTILMTAFIFNVKTFATDHDKKSSEMDIVETAVNAGSFGTLATALTEAGLVDALKGEGPFTVFAPTDDAFKKLPKGTLEGLLKNKEALKKILLYHVVSGNVSSKEVVNLKNAKTLEGGDVKISVKKNTVMINKSKITTADIKAKNGIIHVIDTVLMPPTK
jgi:uncharacterized surface protein with fasciclin (FAS1) repeats